MVIALAVCGLTLVLPGRPNSSAGIAWLVVVVVTAITSTVYVAVIGLRSHRRSVPRRPGVSTTL
jgi:hypothetical protein